MLCRECFHLAKKTAFGNLLKNNNNDLIKTECYIIVIMATVYKVDVLFWFHYSEGSLVSLYDSRSAVFPLSSRSL